MNRFLSVAIILLAGHLNASFMEMFGVGGASSDHHTIVAACLESKSFHAGSAFFKSEGELGVRGDVIFIPVTGGLLLDPAQAPNGNFSGNQSSLNSILTDTLMRKLTSVDPKLKTSPKLEVYKDLVETLSQQKSAEVQAYISTYLDLFAAEQRRSDEFKSALKSCYDHIKSQSFNERFLVSLKSGLLIYDLSYGEKDPLSVVKVLNSLKGTPYEPLVEWDNLPDDIKTGLAILGSAASEESHSMTTSGKRKREGGDGEGPARKKRKGIQAPLSESVTLHTRDFRNFHLFMSAFESKLADAFTASVDAHTDAKERAKVEQTHY